MCRFRYVEFIFFLTMWYSRAFESDTSGHVKRDGCYGRGRGYCLTFYVYVMKGVCFIVDVHCEMLDAKRYLLDGRFWASVCPMAVSQALSSVDNDLFYFFLFFFCFYFIPANDKVNIVYSMPPTHLACDTV